MIDNKRIGLSLSGGGYRATIYHLGTLRKLKELDILDKIDVISTNSGGSITGATYALYGENFVEFDKIILNGVKSSIIKKVILSPTFLVPLILTLGIVILIIGLLFTKLAWLSLILFIAFILIFLRFQFDIFPISKLIEKSYDKLFFNKTNLSDFSDIVKLAINATNAETGTLFTFSKQKMTDSSYRYPKDGGKAIFFNHQDFPISRAVAASTCVPFGFTPVRISRKYFMDKMDSDRANPRLVDGGVYDNQGVHKLTQRSSTYYCDIIIASDAGNSLPFKNTYKNVLPLLIRVSDIFMNRIKNFQMVQQIFNPHNLKEVAYQSLGWNLDRSIPEFIKNIKNGNISREVLESHGIEEKDIVNGDWDKITTLIEKNIDYHGIIVNSNSNIELEVARNVGTNLTALNNDQINALINHAAVLTEIQVKLYCPTLFK